MTDIAAVIDLLTRGGLITALVIALVGGWKGWYVWGKTHDKELDDKDKIITDKTAQLLKTEQDKDGQLLKIEKDRDYWRDMSVRILTASEKTAAKIEVIAQKT